MKVVIFGATGMIGAGVLIECLADPDVEQVVAVVRSPTGRQHPKLREVEHADFFDYSAIRDALSGLDACLFCLGVSAAGKSEEEYTRLTYTLTLAAAGVLAELNPGMKFIYVSGQGADASERGRMMWARVKGRTENALQRLPLEAYLFRPGVVQPMKGVRSKTALYQAAYTVLGPLIPLVRRLFPGSVTTSENIGRAMLRVAREGAPKRVLENRDIDAVAAAG